MNVTINKNRALVLELRRIAAAIERSNELKELELSSVHGVTARVVAAADADLAQTHVSYNDPEFEFAVREMEMRSGRPLTQEEQEKVLAAVEMERGSE